MAAEGWKKKIPRGKNLYRVRWRGEGRKAEVYLCYDSVIYDNEFAPFDWMEFSFRMRWVRMGAKVSIFFPVPCDGNVVLVINIIASHTL